MQSSVNIVEYNLGNHKYLVMNKYKGELLIHIRQYEIFHSGKNEKKYPTKTGIVFRPCRFASFVEKLEWLNKSVTEDQCIHIGGKMHLFINKNGVRLGYAFMKDGKVFCGKKFISLRNIEWNALMIASKELMKTDQLREIFPCFVYHDTDVEIANCSECSPQFDVMQGMGCRIAKQDETQESTDQATAQLDAEEQKISNEFILPSFQCFTPINAASYEPVSKRAKKSLSRVQHRFEQQNSMPEEEPTLNFQQ